MAWTSGRGRALPTRPARCSAGRAADLVEVAGQVRPDERRDEARDIPVRGGAGEGARVVAQAEPRGGAQRATVGERPQLLPGGLRLAEEDVGADVAEPLAALEELALLGRVAPGGVA